MYYNGTKGVITKVTDLKSPVEPINSNVCHSKSNLSGGITSDLDLTWSFSGPILKVFNVTEGTIQSSWDFSSVTRDSRTQVRCVIEYPACDNSRLPIKENQICLIVGYTSKKDASKSSYISFCQPRTSRILHTISTKEKVMCLSLVAAKKDHASPLSGILKTMSGALAIGTQSGNLLLLDLKDIFNYYRRNCFDSLRNRFSEMLILDLKRMSENDIKERIGKLNDQSNHIAVLLSDKKDSRDPDVEICALTYIRESTCLAVGLKNGSFQLWDVNTLKKLYKSPTLEVHTPVVGFGFQEPCNDPQNFCYLWVLYESESKNESCLPFTVMYGILYKKVTTIPTYGRHYRNFVHCKKRFDLDVDLERCINGRCIASSVVSNTSSNILRHAGINEEDASKINLFVMIFETWEHNADFNSSISIVVFDMNQWYKAQMPHQCYLGYAVPFVNFMLLERVSENKGSILDVRIKKDTIQQFLSFNLSEEYSYPSSLSFDTIFLTDSKIIHVRIPGAQRSVLEQMISEGPIGLVNPSKYYTDCKEAGLRPCFLDSFSNTIVPSQIQQRNYILTILLENKISSFLVRCVKDWADGSRGVSGCTLPNLIQWAWDCITRIKLTTDAICVPLFDYSGDDLDRENYQKLKHCVQLIHIICDLLVYIYKNFKQFLLDDIKLKHQVDTLQLVTKYFDVIIWCLDCGLLPEKVSGSTDKCVPTYIINILQYTEQRREELKRIGLKNEYFLIENAPPLIVDAVLEREPKGQKLQVQWQRESGGMTNGLYPPVTLQSLLRMFLLPDVSSDVKHFIILYFLFDVCDYHRDEEMKEQLLSFSIIFSIDTAFFSLVQSCWLLDHEKFDEAIDILTVDAVVSQLRQQTLLYKIIMQACVCQKQYGIALKLERLVKLSGVVFPDERFYITLLLQNGLVMEAYTTMKKVSFGQKEILRHFFRVCDDFGLLKEIFKFPISSIEENEFMSYLDKNSSRDAGDLKIMYLLSRGRYVEAVDVNHNLASIVPKFDVVGHETAKQNAKTGRVTTRDLLVGAFSKTLPDVTNELISFCRKEKDKIYRFKEVKKPTPLSVVVHTDTSHQVPTYKSSFETVLHAAILKTAETWSNFPRLSKRKNFNTSIVKDTPFLRSDIMTPRKNTSSFFCREKEVNTSHMKSDVDEPPSKRRKSELNQILYFVNETNQYESLEPPSVEVAKILTTPHVQKRLNKLLQNTPESSPLTSILKSSEISRFKQPQKVGFNFPHPNKPMSHKVAVIAETPVVSLKAALKHGMTSSTVKKFKTDELIVSPQKRGDVIVENVAVTQQAKVSSPANGSLDTSTNADSYYSLESENEIKDFQADEAVEKQSAMVQATISHQQTFIESMSEDETAEPRKLIVMEVMSEEENVAENEPRQVIVDVHVEETSLKPFVEVTETPISEQTFESSKVLINEPATETLAAVVSKQPIDTTVTDIEERNEINSQTIQFPIQISSTFTVSSKKQSVSSQFEPDENASLATMQPVATELVCGNQESKMIIQSSWESTYEEYRSTNLYTNQPNEDDTTKKLDCEVLREKEDIEVANNASVSLIPKHNAVSVVNEEILDNNCQSQQNNSIIEVRDSFVEEDSDIEILEDESQVSPPRRENDNFDELSTEEDDISENSYESEYTYSQESAEAASNVEENSDAIGEVDGESVDEELQEIGEECEEYEDEDTEDDNNGNFEAEYEEDIEEDSYDEEEQKIEKQSVIDESNVTDVQNEVTVSFDAEKVCRENLSINYEELKKIVSNVMEADAEIVPSSELKEIQYNSAAISSSNENELTCEIQELSQSVVEETINLDYSDSIAYKVETLMDNSTTNANVKFTRQNDDSVNHNQKLDTSTEVLSLSTMAKEESSEPQMVFYFGENSVTSIGEEMLIDESENSKHVSACDQNSEVARDMNKSGGNAEDYNQVADTVVSLEVEKNYAPQNSIQTKSIYIIDTRSESSLEERIAKNRSEVNQSAIPKIDQSITTSQNASDFKKEDTETSPLFISTTVSKDTCIRTSDTQHNPEDLFVTKKSEELVCISTSTIAKEETPASSVSSVDTEPRISVITGMTSPKIISSAPVSAPRSKHVTEYEVSSSFCSDQGSPVSTDLVSRLQLSCAELATSNANQRNLISRSTSEKEVISCNVELCPTAYVQRSNFQPSGSLMAVLTPPSGRKLNTFKGENPVSVDENLTCVVSPVATPHLSSLNASGDEVGRLTEVEEDFSRHQNCPASLKMSSTEQLTEEICIGGHHSSHSISSIIKAESSDILAIDEANRSSVVEKSSLSLGGSPFSGFESPVGQYTAEKRNQSSFGQSVHISKPSLADASTTLMKSRASPKKLNRDEAYKESDFSVSSALLPKQATDASNQPTCIPQHNSRTDDSLTPNEFESSPPEVDIDEAYQSVIAEEHSPVNISQTTTVCNELSYDESEVFSKVIKPIVVYTPSPTKISFSETAHLSVSPVCDTSVSQPRVGDLKSEENRESVCISGSFSPSTKSEKASTILLSSFSNQAHTHTPVTNSPYVVIDEDQSSPTVSFDLQTPEKRLSSQSSVQTPSTLSRNSSITSSPQTLLSASSPKTYDVTYDSHVGGRQPREKDSFVSSLISSPLSDVKTFDVTLTESLDKENMQHSVSEENQKCGTLITPSPRRSLRLARRLSTDSITLDVIPEIVPRSGRSPTSPASNKSTQRSSDHFAMTSKRPFSDTATDKSDNDDAVSVKSAATAAESISSRASTISTRSQTRKHLSFTRLEMRKSSVRPSFKPLQVIPSDEEVTSPTKSEIGSDHRNIVVERKYASSEPGDVSSGSRRSKRSRLNIEPSDEDECFSTGSEKPNRRAPKRRTKNHSEKNLLNSAMLASPMPQKNKPKKLVSSTPMKEQKAPTSTVTAVSNYTMSRRLTRFQKSLLVGGMKRGEQNDHDDKQGVKALVAATFEDVPEVIESVDTKKDFYKGGLTSKVREYDRDEVGCDDDDSEAELTTRAVRNRPIKTRASDVRVSRARMAEKAAAVTSSSPDRLKPPSGDVSSDEESVSSRASTSSRRKGRPSTFTKMELRRSSARPYFKPLSVIPSDEDSDHDHDTSSVSDISSVSTATRRSRRNLTVDMASAVAPLNEGILKSAPNKKRVTKTQTAEISKKRKGT